jgi:rifampicin phosphotransferase
MKISDWSRVLAAPGGWERDPSHFPHPLTPMFASLYLPWQDMALTAMLAEFGYLGGRVQSRLVDGHFYFRVVPAGGWTPPAWFFNTAARLWWVHPAIRSRVQRSRDCLRSDYPDVVVRRWESEWRSRIEQDLNAAVAVDLSALSDPALLRHFDTRCARAGRYVRTHFLLHGAIAPALARLEFMIRDTPTLAGVRTAELVAGLSMRSSEPGVALATMATELRADPEMLERAQTAGAGRVAAAPDELGERVGAGFRSWMAAYGHRVTSRYEFIEPTLAEQPERVAALLLDLASRPYLPDIAAEQGHQREEAEAAARLRLTDVDLARFDTALKAAQRAYPVRDDNVVLTFNASFATVRFALLEMGRRLATGVLDEPGDIFFVTAEEARRAVQGEPDEHLHLHAAARRRTWLRQMAAPPPPPLFGRPPPAPPLDALPKEAAFMTGAIVWYMRGIQALPEAPSGPPDNVQSVENPAPPLLRGIGAVRGRYRGVARVIRGEEDFDRLQHGDVLVCPMTSPAWSALFPSVGALVTDHGGVLSHPAVIAREYGVPAVVATRTATEVIPDGAVVTVDGDAGTVAVE